MVARTVEVKLMDLPGVKALAAAALRLYEATDDAAVWVDLVHHERCISSDNCTCMAEGIEVEAARNALIALLAPQSLLGGTP